jgi:hypothetical protein
LAGKENTTCECHPGVRDYVYTSTPGFGKLNQNACNNFLTEAIGITCTALSSQFQESFACESPNEEKNGASVQTESRRLHARPLCCMHLYTLLCIFTVHGQWRPLHHGSTSTSVVMAATWTHHLAAVRARSSESSSSGQRAASGPTAAPDPGRRAARGQA